MMERELTNDFALGLASLPHIQGTVYTMHDTSYILHHYHDQSKFFSFWKIEKKTVEIKSMAIAEMDILDCGPYIIPITIFAACSTSQKHEFLLHFLRGQGSLKHVLKAFTQISYYAYFN